MRKEPTERGRKEEGKEGRLSGTHYFMGSET